MTANPTSEVLDVMSQSSRRSNYYPKERPQPVGRPRPNAFVAARMGAWAVRS